MILVTVSQNIGLFISCLGIFQIGGGTVLAENQLLSLKNMYRNPDVSFEIFAIISVSLFFISMLFIHISYVYIINLIILIDIN